MNVLFGGNHLRRQLNLDTDTGVECRLQSDVSSLLKLTTYYIKYLCVICLTTPPALRCLLRQVVDKNRE